MLIIISKLSNHHHRDSRVPCHFINYLSILSIILFSMCYQCQQLAHFTYFLQSTNCISKTTFVPQMFMTKNIQPILKPCQFVNHCTTLHNIYIFGQNNIFVRFCQNRVRGYRSNSTHAISLKAIGKCK